MHQLTTQTEWVKNIRLSVMKYSHPPLHLKTSSTLQHQYVNYDTLVATNEGLKQPNHRNKTFFKHNIETKFLIHKFLGKRTHFVCIFLFTYFTVHTTNILLCKLWNKAIDSLHDRFLEAIKTIKQYCKFDRVIFFYVVYRLHF